ncbi:tripartite motif-containing protein 43-like [Ochotona curzoniae]|uniref:tripartite motif-containing protein 43-like n=1 Tax=Ochotona curzoniae TaxID=130825 RepID=UPI001B34D67E|nr:tripartite motif-containing protein 43-like [Ochotona curzoniae]
MDLDILHQVQQELSCAICLNYMMDPVTINCGHSFCRPCVCLTWEEAKSPVRCPVCRKPARKKDFKTNVHLKNLVSIARQASIKDSQNSEEGMCSTHTETRKIFCEEDRSLLCVLCSDPQEHAGHRHCAIDIAAENSREMLVKQMRSLSKQMQENQRNLNEESITLSEWTLYVSRQRENIKASYEMLHPGLHQDEKQHMDTLQKQENSIFQKLKKSKAKMVLKKKKLRQIYEELMKMYHQPDMELLQKLGGVLKRCESLQQQMPQPVHPELRAPSIPGLIDWLRQFQVDISFQYEMTSHFHVRRLMFGYDHQGSKLNSDRFDYAAVWSKQNFYHGKYYWERDMKDSYDWALGVCKDPGIRNKGELMELEGSFLLLCSKDMRSYKLLTTSPVMAHYVEKPMSRVGVFLDFERGSVSFVDISRSSLIWRYPDCSLYFPVRPFIFTRHM